uniref:Rap-GAP domain-containing protein n=1 Tax=Meloidogyne hapla TaxID=6305 RepID=A0A1I8B7Y4_MELHA
MAAANLAPSASNSQNVGVTESSSNDPSSEINHHFDQIALQIFNASRLRLANNLNIQPIALSVDLQYDFCVDEKQAYSNCSDSVFLQDTLIRNSFRRLLLLRSLPPSNSSNDENTNEEKRDEAMGQCMQTIMNTIDQLFANLRAETRSTTIRPAFVERLLDFYWQYQSNIGAFLNSKSNLAVAKSPLFTVPALSDNAACALISYAADNPFISELVWTRVLTTLNTSIQKMPYLIESIVGSGKLFGFFQYFCFIGPSCRIPNMPPNTEIGPSLDIVFEYFVHLLINKSESSLVASVIDILLDVLISVFSKRNFITLSKFSLGALLKISSVLAQFTQKYVNNCNLSKVARLYCVLLVYSKKMLQRAIDPDAVGQFLPADDENASSSVSNLVGMYSHYGNGHSFSVICFSNMDSEPHFGINNDPLEFIGKKKQYPECRAKLKKVITNDWRVNVYRAVRHNHGEEQIDDDQIDDDDENEDGPRSRSIGRDSSGAGFTSSGTSVAPGGSGAAGASGSGNFGLSSTTFGVPTMLSGENDVDQQKSESLPLQNFGSDAQINQQLNRKFSPHSLYSNQLPRISLCIDRMTAGAQKFVVLDFGCKVLLSDLIVPASEYMSSLRIDAWLKDEKTDSIFVASCSEIGAKSLTISDLLPPIICRFLKLTYTVRQLYNESCTVNLGQFFGTQIADSEEKLETKNILCDFILMAEHLKIAYEISANAIKCILRDGNPTFETIRRRSIRHQYQECFDLRLKYNIVRNLISPNANGQ